MEIGVIVAVCALLVSGLGLILSGRKDTRSNAAESARMEAKLDSISQGVDDIRVETRTMRDRISDIDRRVTMLEAHEGRTGAWGTGRAGPGRRRSGR